MHIVFSANNRQETMVLPFPPASVGVESTQENEDFSGLSGPLKLIGNMALRTISLQSFFPIGFRPSGMNPYASTDGWAYVDFLERWRSRKVPLRLVITTDDREMVNMACVIDTFLYEKKINRIEYTLDITEYKFVGD